MRRISLLFGFAYLLFSSCTKDQAITKFDQSLDSALESASPTGNISHFTFPDSEDFANIPQDLKNPITAQKVSLGKLLFHESAIGTAPKNSIGTGTYSCASCHFAGAGFQAGRFQGLGEGGIGFGINGEGRTIGPFYNADSIDAQPIRTPTVMNGAFQENMLWNGQFGATGANIGYESKFTEGTPKAVNNLGYQGLEIQAIAGLSVHRLEINENLMTELGYKEMFDAAFGTEFDITERYTKETAGLAIAAYERTLMSTEAPFQKWLKGDKSAMSEQEKRGAILFFDKAECVSCHTGPALNSNEFYALGVLNLNDFPDEVFNTNAMSDGNTGRESFTGLAEDMYKFKVPQLYNLADSPFYGHGSSFRSIRKMIEYKNFAVKENTEVPISQLADQFVPLGLTQAEIDDLTAFINTGLYDPDLLRFQPATVNSGNCIPVNDPLASTQLNCQ